MSFNAGHVGHFEIDNSGGTPQDISAYLTDCDFEQQIDKGEVTTFGKTAKVYIVTLTDGTFSISGHFDPAVDAILSGIVGSSTTKTFIFGPAGSGAGSVKYTGESILTKYGVKEAVGGTDDFTAEFQCSDVITRTTF